MKGGDCHLNTTKIQRGYIQRYSARLGAEQIEEEEVQNMEKKEQMIMRDGNFDTMIQQKEED